jgi:hypothetical protein
MKKVLFLLVFLPAISFAQSECPEYISKFIEVNNAENETKLFQNADKIFPEDIFNRISDIRLVGRSRTIIIELYEVSDEEFEQLCNRQLNLKALRGVVPNVDFQIMLSCQRKDGKNNIRAFMQKIENPALYQKVIDKERQKTIADVVMRKFRIQKKKELVERLKRYEESLEERISLLDREILSNELTVVHNFEKLVHKHIYPEDLTKLINNPAIQKTISGVDSWVTEKIAEEIGAEILDFGSPLADRIDILVDAIEGANWIAANKGVLPKTGVRMASKVAVFWDLFKSLPEAGKMAGHGVAALTIYFDRRELQKELDDYKRQIKTLQLEIDS